MRNRFDTQLEQLSNRLICMGELCEKAIVNATLALRDGDLNLAKLVIREDEEVDHMEKEIESLCLKLLLQQQPVAKDLRQISAANLIIRFRISIRINQRPVQKKSRAVIAGTHRVWKRAGRNIVGQWFGCKSCWGIQICAKCACV